MNILFYLSVILLAGKAMAKILSKFKLPNVTGYLIGGVIIGSSVLDIIPKEVGNNLNLVSEVALAFIAFSIGSEFSINTLKKLGTGIIIITILEAFMAAIFVSSAMIFIFKQPISFSIVLGSIAATTAPAATLMVIRQYDAKGPVVKTLLPVVAMDDAIGIILFSIATTIAKSIIDTTLNISLWKIIFSTILEIALALLIGLIMGIILTYITKKVKGEEEMLSITLGIILASAGAALALNVSSLLTCMMLGAVIVNLTTRSRRVFDIIDKFAPPILVLFFTIAGVQLDFSVLKKVGIIGMAYVVMRISGKILGAYTGAKISKLPKEVQKYLGFTLVPQAGVAIGLSMITQTIFPGEYGETIRTIILASTVIYELIGPIITKAALMKAGEIKDNSTSAKPTKAIKSN